MELSGEVEVAATGLTVEQAIANLRSPDLSLRYYAAWWLGKFRVREPSAVDALLVALEDEADRTELGGYPLRRNAARALGKLSDRRAVPKLICCLDCGDFYVREAAAQSLAMLGDPSANPALMKLLDGGVDAAVAVPGRPHLTQPYDSVLEALGALQAQEAISLIQPFTAHSMPKIQFAALRAMYQLTQEDSYGQRLVIGLTSDDLKLRRVVLADLGAIGYIGAAQAIASCTAENSFKLLSLKGLLESQLQESQPPQLSDPAIHLMSLMDSLL
jgi:phycocyanobilin lyase alpha subunit